MDNLKVDSDYHICLEILNNAGIQLEIHSIEKDKLDRINPQVFAKIEQIKQISKKLGCSIGIVGGFVRDLLLEKPTEDVDFVVFQGDINELTEEIAAQLGGKIGKMSNRTLTTQIRFSDNLVFEFNSTRKERYEYPSRVPIVEEATIVEDLYRRDFTINALIMFDNHYIDIFSGTKDLENGLIQTTRDPETVFHEDYLRMFRAIRFACRLNFTISDDTKDGIKLQVKNILDVPSERIIHELKLSLEHNPLLTFQLMVELGILETMFPQIKDIKVDQKIFNVSTTYRKIESEIQSLYTNDISDIYLYIAVILKEVSSKIAGNKENIDDMLKEVEEILRKYKFSNKETNTILSYLEHYILLVNFTQKQVSDAEIRLFIRSVDSKINMVFHLLKAIQSVKVSKINFENLEKRVHKLGLKRELIDFKIALNGKEIAAHFNIIGHEIGKAKNLLTLAIMNEEITNTKEECIKFLERYFSRD